MTEEERRRRRGRAVIAMAARYVKAKQRHPQAMFASRARITPLNAKGRPRRRSVECGPLVIW